MVNYREILRLTIDKCGLVTFLLIMCVSLFCCLSIVPASCILWHGCSVIAQFMEIVPFHNFIFRCSL